MSAMEIFRQSSFRRAKDLGLKSFFNEIMKRELATATLTLATLSGCLMCAAQLGSVQTGTSQTVQSMSDRKPQKIYHIGGDVKPPRVISSPQPSLDEEETRKLNAGKKIAKTGSATVTIIVGEDGTVQNARVVESFNHDLDAQALKAIKQWKFEPAVRKGVPVAVQLSVQVTFHLYE